MKPPLFVLGMHRSGTSMITGALQRAGFYLGPESDLKSADEHNKSGYFEFVPILQINEQIRQMLGLVHNPCLSLPADWHAYEGMAGLAGYLAELLKKTFGDAPFAAFKDPRTSMLLPIYQSIYGPDWEDAKALICVRNPLDVAKSFSCRDPADERPVLGMWLQHTLSSLKDSESMRRRVVIYEDYLQDPVKALEPVFAMYPDFDFSAERRTAIAASVRKDLNHGGNPSLADLKPDIFARTYELCRRFAADPSLLDSEEGRHAADDLLQETDEWWSLPPIGTIMDSNITLTVRDGRGENQVVVRYRPALVARTFPLQFEAPPGVPIGLRLSYWPGTAWIKHATITDEGSKKTPIQLRPTMNVMPEETHIGTAWNLMSNGDHFGFPSLGGKQLLEITFSSLIDPDRVANLMSRIWPEYVQLKQRLSGPK